MTVVDKHTCSSPVAIKLAAICVAVDVKVDRFDFFVSFLSVEVISCRHTVLILYAQWNGVEDSVRDFSVASEVTSGIDHRRTDPMSFALSLKVPFSASSSIQLSIVMISWSLLRAFPGEDGTGSRCWLNAVRCSGG